MALEGFKNEESPIRDRDEDLGAEAGGSIETEEGKGDEREGATDSEKGEGSAPGYAEVDGRDNEAGGFGVIHEEDTESDLEEERNQDRRDRQQSQSQSQPQPQHQPERQQNGNTASSSSSTNHGAGTSTPPRGRTRNRGSSTDRHNAQRKDGQTTMTGTTQDDWIGWEGEVIPSLKQISVGGFRAAGLAVRVRSFIHNRLLGCFLAPNVLNFCTHV